MYRKFLVFSVVLFFLNIVTVQAQTKASNGTMLAPTPPMGWMTWNFFADNIHEKDIRQMADAMVETGMVKAGYNTIMIDDGWQGGRDNRNNIIPDPKKFPSALKPWPIMCTVKALSLVFIPMRHHLPVPDILPV